MFEEIAVASYPPSVPLQHHLSGRRRGASHSCHRSSQAESWLLGV